MTSTQAGSVVIYQEGDRTVAVSSIGAKKITENRNAAHVFQTILDSFREGGGKLQVEPGCYRLGHGLRIFTRTVVSGSGPCSVMLPDAHCRGGAVFHVKDAHHVSVTDICIDGKDHPEALGTGVLIEQGADCIIDRVTCRNFRGYGFLMKDYSAFCKFHHCTGANNRKANFRMENLCGGRDAPVGQFVPNQINACYAYGGGIGFDVFSSLCQNITACVAYQAGAQAYRISHQSQSTLISGCRSFQTGAQAVLVEDSAEINISSSIFCWQKGHGIELKNVTWGIIGSNEIMDSGASTREQKYNLYLHTDVKSIQVSGNCLFTWADQLPTQSGVFEDDTCRHNHIVGNTVNYYTREGLALHGDGTVAVHNRTFREPYPNPGLQPFRKPNKNHGRPVAPFTRDRLHDYIDAVDRDLRPPPQQGS